MSATIHASAVLLGARAALIRGPSGCGKSRLALALLQAAQAGALMFARLVGDDRCQVEAMHSRLLVRPAPALAGLIEMRGLGIQRVAYEPVAVAGFVIDLGEIAPDRLPAPSDRTSEIAGVPLPRLAVAAGTDPLPLVLAYLGGSETECQFRDASR
jgi:serine kinase of HPr protein (carbohydrate metabolism regulator)